MKKTLLFLLVATGLLLVTQGLLLKQIIPLEPFLLLVGISPNTLGLFILPFLILFIKFAYLLFGFTAMLIFELKNSMGKKFDPNLPSASVLGSPRFNVSKKLTSSFHPFFIDMVSEFFLWGVLISTALSVAGLYVHLDLIENNRQGISPLLLNLLTGLSLIISPFIVSRKNLITTLFSKFKD